MFAVVASNAEATTQTNGLVNYNHGRINKDLTLIIYYKFHAKHISSTSLPSRPAAQPFPSDARISFQIWSSLHKSSKEISMANTEVYF